jgi:cytochrome oxidase assembly protein ShyY1
MFREAGRIMDVTSPHIPYIIGAYGFGICVLVLLTYWVIRQDRKVCRQFADVQSYET